MLSKCSWLTALMFCLSYMCCGHCSQVNTYCRLHVRPPLLNAELVKVCLQNGVSLIANMEWNNGMDYEMDNQN